MNETLDEKIRYRAAVARAHSQVISGQSSTVMVKEAPAYSGRALQILPIVLGNLMLTFLTLGIYRFWAKTRIRRYFVSRVSFLSDPLGYDGTGLELFKGFLIVLAIMVPFLIAMGLVQQLFFAPGAHPIGAAAFQVVYMLTLYFLYNVAVYRAQRYRLSRTSWRGIRGGQQGSALVYASSAMGLGLLTLLTLGLAYPVMRRVLVGYRIRYSAFGTETLRFDGGFFKLFAAWLVPWLLIAAFIALLAYALRQQDLASLAAANAAAAIRMLPPVLVVLLLATALLLPIALIWYRAFETRHWINNTQFDRLEFASRLRAWHILVPYLAYGVSVFIALGGAFYFYLVTGNLITWSKTAPFVGIAAIAVIWLLASILKPLIIQNWLLRNFCKTTTIQGSFSPDRLFQSQLRIPRRGEGLADALDVDAF